MVLNNDILLVLLSDMHSGSNLALFPNREWNGIHGGYHRQNSVQAEIYRQWLIFMGAVAQERKNKKVILVNLGDAIEGLHHRAVDVFTRDVDEQAEIHIELMHEFKSGINWQRGDKLYYVLGTETHVLEKEHKIADMCGAEQMPNGDYVSNHLQLDINGRTAWFVHKGRGAGAGANEGNALRNWLRDIFIDSLKAHKSPPDAIYSGHVHNPSWNVYVGNESMHFKMIHGIILPSFQTKTRYAYGVAPVTRNRVGGAFQNYTKGGDIRPPVFVTSETGTITKA